MPQSFRGTLKDKKTLVESMDTTEPNDALLKRSFYSRE